MRLYWTIHIALITLAFIEQGKVVSTKIIRRIFYCSILVLFCLSFLRWERGSDWIPYYEVFMTNGEYGEYLGMEWGYLLFNRIVRKVTDNYTIYLFFQSGIYYSLYIYLIIRINKFLKKEYKIGSCYFPILLYSFCQGFAGIFNVRGSISYLICAISILSLYNRQYKRFFLELFMALSFHKSSILFAFVLPMFKVKSKRLLVVLIVLFTFIVTMFSARYVDILDSTSYEDYSRYIIVSERHSIIGIIKWVSVLLAFYVLRSKYLIKFDKIVNITFLVGVIIYIWCQFYSPVGQRVAAMFMGVIVYKIGMICYNYKIQQRMLILFGEVVFTTISLWSSLNSSTSDLFIPYKFFWDTFSVEVY